MCNVEKMLTLNKMKVEKHEHGEENLKYAFVLVIALCVLTKFPTYRDIIFAWIKGRFPNIYK